MSTDGWDERRVMLVISSLLRSARPIIDDNLAGLTDEEYLWEPVPACWSVRRRADVTAPNCWGRGDWVVETCLDGSVSPPMTTIAWRLMHAYDCTNDFSSRAFGRGSCDWNDIVVSPTAASAVDLMRGALDRLATDLDTNDDSVFLAAPDPDFGRERWHLLAQAVHEAVHHCAEIGVLRALYPSQRAS